jgi:Zn-dependent peptidase ImmA (M78 family)/transcriptional regulator with XRE-family HTH domain
MAGEKSEFGARIARERDLRGWSLRRLAEKADLPLARVQRIEGDANREVGLRDAVQLADAFGIPAAWLINGSQVRARVRAAARADSDEAASAALDTVMPVIELGSQLDDLGIERESRAPVPYYPRHRIGPIEWGETTAAAVRSEWGIANGPLIDLIDTIEGRSDVIVAVSQLPETVDGLAVRDPEMPTALIAVARTRSWARQRFTIAHELGHLIAGDQVIETVKTAAGRSTPNESAASEFARNLLIPQSDLRNISEHLAGRWGPRDIAKIAWQYRVSPDVVAIQLRRLNLITETQLARFRGLPTDVWSVLGGWAPEGEALSAAASTRRVPPVLMARATEAWSRALLPVETIARLTGDEAAELDRRFSALGFEPVATAG